MSSHKFVCFECRVSAKRNPYEDKKVRCPSCGSICIYIGVKIPVPPKSKPKDWEKLRRQLTKEISERENKNNILMVSRKHDLEKELLKLELLPKNSGRLSLIKKLKKELDQYDA